MASCFTRAAPVLLQLAQVQPSPRDAVSHICVPGWSGWGTTAVWPVTRCCSSCQQACWTMLEAAGASLP